MIAFAIVEACPDCGARLALRLNRRDRSHFIGCSAFPACRFAEPYVEREQRLAERISALEDSMLVMPSSPGDVLAKELKLLARRFHPDLHGGAEWATQVCGAVLELRERIAGRRAV